VKSSHLAFFLGRPRRGGAERVFLTLAREFVRRGHRVDLVLARRDGPLLNEVPDQVRVFEIGVPGVVASLPAILRLPAAAWPIALHPANPSLLRSAGRLADYLQANRPDALLSTLRSENLTAIWAAELAGTKTRVVVREANTQSAESSSETMPLKRNYPAISRRWFPRAYRTIAVSDSAARDLIGNTGIAPSCVETIYNPVKIDEVEANADEPLDDPWFGQDPTPVFVTAGRLVVQKDQQTLIRAFSILREKRRARLLILGEGPERENLEALASESGIAPDVRLPGSVANPHKYFSRAQGFVLSSGWEGFPNVLVEALACGCPVVSTDCPGGAAEILGDGAFGALVSVGDADAMAAAMAALLDARPDPQILKRRAATFSVDRAASAYAHLLIDDEAH
jgi:glycosyltransferase involved in cell wall biosynthesis